MEVTEEKQSGDGNGATANPIERLRSDLSHAVHGQQTALEILANLCAGDDDEQWKDDEDEESVS